MMAKAATETTDKTYRIWVDGCFDFFHHGHANILRQAKQLFPSVYLIVGVHSDASILLNKGPSIMKQDERYQQVRACKWTDEVVEDAPYFTSLEMVKKWNVDFVVHGDDITTLADGTDCYQAVKDAGMYMECKRTVGVSTTEIVGRMLLMSKDHLKFKNPFQISNPSPSTPSTYYSLSSLPLNFLTYPTPTIKPTDRVYYVDGGFDLFHYAHVKFLAKLKEECDFLIVGIHDDECVNAIKGKNYPIMTLYERGLCVLACRYVDDVILGAPYTPSISALLSKYSHITHIVHGSTVIDQDVDDRSPYDEAKELFKIVESPEPDVTTETIINRILENRTLYEERNRKKNTAKKELKN